MGWSCPIRSPSLGLGATGTGRDSGADSRPTARSRSLPAASYYLRPVGDTTFVTQFLTFVTIFLRFVTQMLHSQAAASYYLRPVTQFLSFVTIFPCFVIIFPFL